MKKVLLLLVVFFIFFQVSAGSINALECSIGCKQNGAMSDLRCYYQSPIQKIGSVYSTCMINPQNDGTTSAWSYGSSCYDATNNNFCKSNGCPTNSDNSDVANQNGAPCKVILPCVSGSSCSSKDYDGKWDASESRCVICGSNKESIICGDSAGTYIGDGTNVYSPNINCPNFIWCSKAGDQQFESACGADSACDEKVKDAICTTSDGSSGKCDDYGKCIVGGITPVCIATLSLSAGTGDPCSVSASISATGCDGKSYQVKEGSTVKCSGTVSGGAGSCSFSQSGAKSYDLYVDGSAKDMGKQAACGRSV